MGLTARLCPMCCFFAVLAFGGDYNQNPDYGAFLLNANEASNADDNLGARHLVVFLKIHTERGLSHTAW